MGADLQSFDVRGLRVGIRRPVSLDCEEFLGLARESVEFLRPWIDPPVMQERYEGYLRKREASGDGGGFVCEVESGRIVGVINVSCIVRGFFQSAFLGYWVGARYAKRGYMSEAMGLLVGHAFDTMGLHRLEANIQPGNLASIALARKCGFKKEGFSPGYLQVMGEWRDHERWAIRAEG